MRTRAYRRERVAKAYLVHVDEQKRLRDGWFIVQSRASLAVSARADLCRFGPTRTSCGNNTQQYILLSFGKDRNDEGCERV